MPNLGPRAVQVDFDDALSRVRLEDGREIAVPLAWLPKLATATPDQLAQWRLIGRGIGIHWENLDEDLSVAGLLG